MELNFLTIADTPEDLQPLRALLAVFEREKEIQLSLRRVGWDHGVRATVVCPSFVATDNNNVQNSTTCFVLAAQYYTPESSSMAGALGVPPARLSDVVAG